MSWSVSFSGGKEEVLADLTSVRRAVDAAADHVSASNAQQFAVSLSGDAGDSQAGVATHSSLQTGAQGQQAGVPASQQAPEPAKEESQPAQEEPQAQADGGAGGEALAAAEEAAEETQPAPQLSPNQIIQGTLT